MTQKTNTPTRLILRALRYSDAEAIESYVSDIDVAGMTARIPHPFPKGEALKHLKRTIPELEKGQELAFAIVFKENENDLIGAISLEKLTGCEPEIGYWLGKPYWGRGLMTEALKEIIKIAFSQHSMGSLFARTHLQNAASQKVLLKAGFVESGQGTCNSPAREETVVAANLFELKRERWASLKERVI